jgi:uncharacterized protein YllA (UPF0747 family)
LKAAGRGAAGQPAGTIEIAEAPVSELARALDGFPFAAETLALVEDAYAPGRTFGQAFHALLRKLLAPYGFVFVDPLEPKLRQLAAPLLEKAFGRNDELVAALIARATDLKQAGYHAQVLVESATTLFFELRDGIRRRLKPGERPVDAASLSPNALLRPVMQDTLLPTAAYVGGPAEIAYFAQSSVLYQALGVPMPLAAPRSGFTILDSRAAKALKRFELSWMDCLQNPEALQRQIAARLVPAELTLAFDTARASLDGSLDQLHAAVKAFDPTLGEALTRSRAKITYQLEKNRAKAAREALRRETRAGESAARLSGLVFPEHHLQERLYTILPFLARHGLELPETLAAHLSAGHVVVTP